MGCNPLYLKIYNPSNFINQMVFINLNGFKERFFDLRVTFIGTVYWLFLLIFMPPQGTATTSRFEHIFVVSFIFVFIYYIPFLCYLIFNKQHFFYWVPFIGLISMLYIIVKVQQNQLFIWPPTFFNKLMFHYFGEFGLIIRSFILFVSIVIMLVAFAKISASRRIQSIIIYLQPILKIASILLFIVIPIFMMGILLFKT